MSQPSPAATGYGKAAVAFYRAGRRGELFAAEVRIVVTGEGFVPAYTRGDNTLIVTTDTMKNFVHAMALDYPGGDLDGFLVHLGREALAAYPQVEHLQLRGRELSFTREKGVIYGRRNDDCAVAELSLDRSGIRDHRSGREGIRLVKLTGSAFTGFMRDAYTTLPDAPDRPLLVHLNVYWRRDSSEHEVAGAAVRSVVVDVFEEFVSQSIQHLVHEIGQRLLQRFPAMVEVSFEAENHLWDAAASAPDAGVRVYTDPRPPYGVINLTLRR